MAKSRVYAHIILDRSGSMGVNVKQTVGAINEYITGLQKQDDVSARISLSLFDEMALFNQPSAILSAAVTHTSPVFQQGLALDLIRDNVKAKECRPLTEAEYQPRGGTPLNDAIGNVVAQIDAQTRREGESVVLVIMTDGQENASKEFSKDAIKALLDDRKAKKNWLVIYLGADHDAFAASASYGIDAATTMQFNKMSVGNRSSMAATARSTVSYGASGSAAKAAFLVGERAAARSAEDDPVMTKAK